MELSSIIIMGNCNKKTTASIDNATLDTPVGKCGISHCASSCCDDVDETEHKKAEQLHEIQLALRYGKNMGEAELLAAIKKIVAETGQVPDILVIPPGKEVPALTKRTLSVRIGDHSP